MQLNSWPLHEQFGTQDSRTEERAPVLVIPDSKGHQQRPAFSDLLGFRFIDDGACRNRSPVFRIVVPRFDLPEERAIVSYLVNAGYAVVAPASKNRVTG